MATTCSDGKVSANVQPPGRSAVPGEAPVQTLLEVAQRYGTPTYAYDLDRIRAQVDKLRANLPPEVEVLYSLKANPSLGLCGFLARSGLGADVASAGELLTARQAGFPPEQIFVTGPDRSPAMLAELRSVPEAMVSVDSASELELIAAEGLANRLLLRLRPDFRSFASCATGPGLRFGLLLDDLARCREIIRRGSLRVIGFHVFAGSQVLDAAGLVYHFRGAAELARRAADLLDLVPEILDIGGGFGIAYGPADQDLDLAPVREELSGLAPARLALELGRYLVGPSGWYDTTVLAHQTHGGRPAVVVDGGTHQRSDLCGLGLRHKAFAPLLLRGPTSSQERVPQSATRPTDVLGCLSLPSDVLAEAACLPPLALGDVLAFPNAGAYGLGASPFSFHCHAAPAEVAFAGTRIEPLRLRQPVRDVLRGQTLLQPTTS